MPLFEAFPFLFI